jgi:Fuc2NAc and GlcNAc transferase
MRDLVFYGSYARYNSQYKYSMEEKSLTKWLALCVLPLLISLIMSRLVIHYFGNRLLDHPNIRSSHQTPTPRGGGIALTCGVVITLLTALWLTHIEPAQVYWLLLPSGLIATLGICDDFFNLNVRIRLITQFLLAGLGVYLIGINNEWSPPIRLLISCFIILFIVWMTNLYNFMDGINGLAALEAISVCLAMAFIYWMQAANTDVIYLLMIIASSTFGFLFWNFPKAKLFMGDAGSLFLGLSFGLLIIESTNENFRLAIAWLIMLGVFIVDASYTLTYRFISKQLVHQAHRTHAYQKAATNFNSHAKITFAIVAINVFWLLPIATAVTITQSNSAAALLIAYAPLLLLAQKLQAGRAE